MRIVVIGAGVAGLAAAIAATRAGFPVVVLERGAAPPRRPGETLHPGCGPIFELLGLSDALEQSVTARPRGVRVRWPEGAADSLYGGSPALPWLGYQLDRERLHGAMLAEARRLGATVRFGCPARTLADHDRTSVCVETAHGPVEGDWLLDGSGPTTWSVPHGRARLARYSPRMTAGYRYVPDAGSSVDIDWPCLAMRPWGWTWQAALGDGRVAVVDLYRDKASLQAHRCPANIYTDATWLIARHPAEGRVFRVGDAAGRLDPSVGRGVLRAMMSSIMAVHLVRQTAERGATPAIVTQHYCDWFSRWITSDMVRLRDTMRHLNPAAPFA